MILNEKQENRDLLVNTIEHLEKQGYTDIKADLEGYEKPNAFTMKSSGDVIVPDIVAKNKKGRELYVEVGVKSDDPVVLKTKWKLLKTLCEVKDRGFKVFAHRGHYKFTDDILKEMKFQKMAVRL